MMTKERYYPVRLDCSWAFERPSHPSYITETLYPDTRTVDLQSGRLALTRPNTAEVESTYNSPSMNFAVL